MRCTVDTNVPIVANGRPDPTGQGKQPTVECRLRAVAILKELLECGTILLDMDGEIQSEYRRHLSPTGQPGVGDRFYLAIINSAPGRVERKDLPRSTSGDYVDFPTDPALKNFDPSDRKFAALSRRYGVPVLTATDSDWVNHRQALNDNGININFVCGCNPQKWFE